ncbi:response regulator [Streptomyces sp. NPDC054766]
MPSDAKILIVDDHEDTLYALESVLAPLGYRVVRATGGDEALKEVLRGQVALLLLDVRMPGVSGLDVVRYLRRLEQTQHIPVILLTGFGPDAGLTATAFGLGVADLLMKPVDPWALRTKVRYLYEAQRRHQALEAELRELRALVKEHTPAPALAHPDGRIPGRRRPGQDPRPPREDPRGPGEDLQESVEDPRGPHEPSGPPRAQRAP